MPHAARGLAWAAGIALALAGCGDLPLVDTLQRESPGELRFSPDSALVPEDTSFTFLVLGGFTPYTVTAVGVAITAIDEHTYQFGGGTVSSGATQDYPLSATERLVGDSAQAVVTVYVPPTQPLALNAQYVTLVEGDSWPFAVTGGQSPYTWSLDGQAQGTGGTYPFPAVAPGSYTVSVSDDIGVTRAAIVEVVALLPDGSPLRISPGSVTVVLGGSVVFTALGGTTPYDYVFSVNPLVGDGTITPEADGNPVTFSADVQGACEVLVTEGAESAIATVTVAANPVQALQLMPDSPTVSTVGEESQIYFSATGGTAPYTFESLHPQWASMQALGVDRAVYTQLVEGKNVGVKVEDANGTSKSTMVFWR